MKNNNNLKDNSFWIAYADLMAGLLFVFILLIGAIVVKYVLTQSDLISIKENLYKKEKKLQESEDELKSKELTLLNLSLELNNTSKNLNILNKEKKGLEANISTYKQMNADLNSTLDIKDQQILVLLDRLNKKDQELNTLKNDFEEIKKRVINLNNTKDSIIAQIKDKLDSNTSINLNTGAIVLPAEVLFDRDSYVLKNEAKIKLKKVLKDYFNAILQDENVLNNIDSIVIEGHTDSDGSYIYNLDLSQKRAYEVMSFIYSFYKDPKLQKLLIASGRSYSEPILVNGKEDKNKSRRIEIKFKISNNAAIKEVENFFEFK